ncbi:MAG: nucleotide sugar dehydrogenase [Dehalococcoidales bacterium]|nr:nucleotide sugar dehydrogenase [Dehalococcoidales bacterium]
MKVGVIGLGKLGICMASVYANRGHKVVGVDVNAEIIEHIQNKQCPVDAVEEKGLHELLQTVPLKVSTGYDILKGTEIVIVIVPTPSKSDGRYDNRYIVSALENLCEAVKDEPVKPVVVIKSTVIPGSCENEFAPLLDKYGMDLCYSAEMVGLGNVVNGIENPEELLLGQRNKETGDFVSKFYDELFAGRTKPPLRRMSLWNAEMSKLTLNVFLIAKVTLANTIARVCDETPTGNIEDVMSFVGNDSRIGTKFLQTGLGMGGPCFPRDAKALISVVGQDNAIIPSAVDAVNMAQPLYIYDKIQPVPKTVSILGVTYKNEIQLIDVSMVTPLIEKMASNGVTVRIHDPKGLPDAKNVYGDSVYYASDIEDCLKDSELVIIGTAWNEYRDISADTLKSNMKTPAVYDCWRILDAEEMRANGVKYHAFGVNDA